MSRYGENVRRIAQTDDLTKRILQAEQKLDVLDKAAIPGSRAIAYPSGSLQSGTPGSTNPDNNGNQDPSLQTTDKSKLDGGGLDDKKTDGDKLINGTTVLQKGDDIGALELKDCDTGEKIDVRIDAASNPGETKFKHPPGWSIDGKSQASTGYDHWLLGFYWRGISSYFGTGSASNQDGTCDAPTAETGYKGGIGFHSASFGYTVTDARLGSGGIVYTDSTHATVHAEYYVDWSGTSFPGNTGWVPNDQAWSSNSCGAESGTARCITAIPTAFAHWQDQDATYHHQLAFSAADGGFVSSPDDLGLPSKFRNDDGSGVGLNNLRLCTNDGKQVEVSALSDGTFAYFEEDGFGGVKTDAKVFHFDSAGKYKDILRPDEYDYLKSTNLPTS